MGHRAEHIVHPLARKGSCNAQHQAASKCAGRISVVRGQLLFNGSVAAVMIARLADRERLLLRRFHERWRKLS